MKDFLFYLLLLLIPVQLGRHFFFDFASVSGIYSDYLTPTLYLTDIIIILLIMARVVLPWVSRNAPSPPLKLRGGIGGVMLFVICYLLFNALFVAENKWAAVYKFIKILEFILLGVAISRMQPKVRHVIGLLSVSALFSSLLAIWQFIIQKSVGGIFWWLGERTFYATTPGIAAFAYNGNLLLRPYATFPHPNVLGGFLAVVLPFVLLILVNNWQKVNKLLKTLTVTSLVVSIVALALTFSRVAWLVTFLGLTFCFLEKKFQISAKLITKKEAILFGFYLFIGISIILPLVSPSSLFAKHQYWQERVALIKTTIPMIAVNLPFGIGLNNSIIRVQNYIKSSPRLYIFQPVHNIYLLILTETGLIGFLIFILTTLVIINKSLQSKSVFLYPFLQLLALGAFDHYLFTLQQGQLLFVIFAALTFIPKMAY